MQFSPRFLFAAAALLAGVVALAASLAASSGGTKAADPRLAAELRQGGLVVVFRHADADDSAPAEPGCGGQANLTGDGRSDAQAIRSGIDRLSAPVGAVLVSPLCRTQETARLALPGAAASVRNDLVREPTRGEDSWHRQIQDVRRLFGARPRAGTNTVVITHSDVIDAAVGVSADQGEAVVLRPLGNGRFKLLDRIEPGDWSDIKR